MSNKNPSAQQQEQSVEWRQFQNGRKYLQIINLTKYLYPKYTKSSTQKQESKDPH